MKRFTGFVLVMLLVSCLSVALAQRVECSVGGFSVKLPDHFVEEAAVGDPDLCFYWHGNKLTVQAYASYQGEVAGSDMFEVMSGSETESGYVNINGMNMLYSRTEDYGDVIISYTWMDRGNSVTLTFTYSAEETSVQKTVNSIINSIQFDAGH